MLVLVTVVAAAAVAIAVLAVVQFRRARELEKSLDEFNDELLATAGDASVGRRLTSYKDTSLADVASTVNRLFDALAERDEEIQDRDRLFAEFARTIPEVVLIHDERLLLANDSAASLLGLSHDQLQGRNAADLVKPAYRALFRKTMARRLGGEEAANRLEIQLINGDGHGLWVEAQSSPIEYRGQPAVLTVARDVSYRKSLEVNLGRSRQQAQYTLESIAEGVITTDAEGCVDYMNRAAESMTGMDREAAAGKRVSDIFSLIDEADRRSLGDPVDRCLAMRRRVNMGRRALLVSADSEHEHSVEITASPIKGPGSSITGAVVVFHDVSELRGLTRQMSYQATHDALTGLINRREFERRLQEAMDQAHAEEVSHILCYMDLDRFKAVNDSCGHLAGDSMLREVASLIKKQVRDSDFVGRLGGDEFGTLLVRCPIEKAIQISNDICNAVADYRFVWQDKIFNIGISIGLVQVSQTSGNLEDIVSAADSACYVAKQRGRGQVHVYSSRDEAIARERGDIQWLRQMQTALNEDRFELALQSIIAIGGQDSGPAFEVLLRMPDDRDRLSDSAEFLRPAQRYQLMPQIDRWVVSATLAALGSGELRLPKGRSCSINISGQTLDDEGFLSFVVDALDRSGVAPGNIAFEVSESVVTSDLHGIQRFIEVLHGIGCEFALDDFGSGLGAFSKLKTLSVDYLKIDGAYTRNLLTDEINQQTIVAMIKLARTMQFRVIAEQVENQKDFDWLRDHGVDFVQGNFIDEPATLGTNVAASGHFRALNS